MAGLVERGHPDSQPLGQAREAFHIGTISHHNAFHKGISEV